MRTGTRHKGRLVRGAAEARSLLWGIASLILLFNALLVAWVLLKPGNDAVVALVLNVAEFVGPLLVVPLCFGGLRRLWRRGTSRTDKGTAVSTIGQRWAPVLLGIGILSFAFGQIVFTYYEWVLQQAPPLPSLADVGFQIQYPFLLLGILLLSARPIPAASRARIALDGLIIMSALVTLSWYFVLGPVVQQEGQTTLAKVVAVAQPLADVVLVACLLILASRPSEHTLRPALRLLALGLALVVVADSYFTYHTLHDTYATGSLLDVGWPLGYMLVALGAFVARLALTGETATTSPEEQPANTLRGATPLAEQRVWRSLLPYVLVPVVGILVVYVWRTSTGSDSLAAGVYVGGALLIGLVLLRQVFTMVENARLYNRLLEYVRNVDRVTDAAAAVEAGEFDPETIAQVAARRDELGRLARVFQQMAREVRAREQRLEQEVQQLRIEIDETRTARQVSEITETDYVQDHRHTLFPGRDGQIEYDGQHRRAAGSRGASHRRRGRRHPVAGYPRPLRGGPGNAEPLPQRLLVGQVLDRASRPRRDTEPRREHRGARLPHPFQHQTHRHRSGDARRLRRRFA